MSSKLYPCPYCKATTCDLKETCMGCETFSEYKNGNTKEYMIRDITQRIVDEMVRDMNSQLEKAVKVCLKAKGFEFESQYHFEIFLKKRCRMEDYTQNQEKILFVDDKPFFRWYYKAEFEFKDNMATCSHGSFQCI